MSINLKTNLQWYWNLSDASGSSITDQHNGLVLDKIGTVTTGATTGPGGGPCVNFGNNLGKYRNASVPYLPAYHTGYTVNLWVLSTGSNSNFGNWVFCHREPGSNANQHFEMVVRGAPAMFGTSVVTDAVSTKAGASGRFATTEAIPINTWQMLTLRDTGGTTELWRNGVLIGSTTSTLSSRPTGNAPFSIGSHESTLAAFIDHRGRVAKAGVWNAPLSGAEIAALYNSGSGLLYSELEIAPEPLTAGVASLASKTHASASIAWTAATGGTGLIANQLEIRPSGAGTWSDVTGATASPGTAAGLAPETEYDFRVRHTDAAPSTVYSNTVAVETDSPPPPPVLAAVIHDDSNSDTGTITRMGPCFIGFRMTGSGFGASDFGNIKPEWDFDDAGSPYNYLRGFAAGHFYDIEAGAMKQVTLTLTDVAQDSDQATRNITITPNTRTKIYIDPDIGTASPANPSNPATPYNTPANAWAGTSGSNIEFILAAGKTHVWTTNFNGNGSRHNILVRSSQRGVKANIQSEASYLIGRGNYLGAMDLHFVPSTRTTWSRIIDARYSSGSPATACWVVDCTSEDLMMCAGVADGSSFYTLWQNVQTSDETNINNLYSGGEGTIVLGCDIEHGEGEGYERPIRCLGDHLLVWDTATRARRKNAFTREGGQWCWISDGHFKMTSGNGCAMTISHSSGASAPPSQFSVVEKTLCEAPEGTSSGVNIELCSNQQGAEGIVLRNVICDGGVIQSILASGSTQPRTDIRLHNVTVRDEFADRVLIGIQPSGHERFRVESCLGISPVTRTIYTIRVSAASLAAADPWVANNAMPPRTGGLDILAGTVEESFATWNARSPNYGTGNIAKSITLDANYRPVDIETDSDLVVTMPPDMINFQEDYYGNPRDPENWTVGAVAAVTEEEVASGDFVSDLFIDSAFIGNKQSLGQFVSELESGAIFVGVTDEVEYEYGPWVFLGTITVADENEPGKGDFVASLEIDSVFAGSHIAEGRFIAEMEADAAFAGQRDSVGTTELSLEIDSVFIGDRQALASFVSPLEIDSKFAGEAPAMPGEGLFAAGLEIGSEFAGQSVSQGTFTAGLEIDAAVAGLISTAGDFIVPIEIAAAFVGQMPAMPGEGAFVAPLEIGSTFTGQSSPQGEFESELEVDAEFHGSTHPHGSFVAPLEIGSLFVGQSPAMAGEGAFVAGLEIGSAFEGEVPPVGLFESQLLLSSAVQGSMIATGSFSAQLGIDSAFAGPASTPSQTGYLIFEVLQS